ncbi:hypothetical protein A616_08635 [Brevibacillus brevis X23]|nr:hypothetical protein A616_08635 [Brevibacillus brevis X23]
MSKEILNSICGKALNQEKAELFAQSRIRLFVHKGLAYESSPFLFSIVGRKGSSFNKHLFLDCERKGKMRGMRRFVFRIGDEKK